MPEWLRRSCCTKPRNKEPTRRKSRGSGLMGSFQAIEPRKKSRWRAGRWRTACVRKRSMNLSGQEELLEAPASLFVCKSSGMIWVRCSSGGRRGGENDPGANHRKKTRSVYSVQRGPLRHEGNQGSDGQGRERAALRPEDEYLWTKCTGLTARSRTLFFRTSKPEIYCSLARPRRTHLLR